MTYKEAYDRLKTEIQFALTDYENCGIEEKVIPLSILYRVIVDIINGTEHWEVN